jgi:hypothetical protein
MTFVVKFAAQGPLVATPIHVRIMAATIQVEPVGLQLRHGVGHHLVMAEDHERPAVPIAVQPLDLRSPPGDVARCPDDRDAVLVVNCGFKALLGLVVILRTCSTFFRACSAEAPAFCLARLPLSFTQPTVSLLEQASMRQSLKEWIIGRLSDGGERRKSSRGAEANCNEPQHCFLPERACWRRDIGALL